MTVSGPAAMPRPEQVVPAAPLSRPGTYFGRVVVFLVLTGIAVAFLRERILTAFFSNPVLNALIGVVLAAGIGLALRSLWQVDREVRWANGLQSGSPAAAARPHLLAPLVGVLTGATPRLTPLTQRALVESLDTRLFESRDILRYLAGLLVFLGLLGTFWGLLETVGSIGRVIGAMHGTGESGTLFEDLKSGLAAPLGGMGISFSSSLFGLAGSLVLGFLDLQVGRAHARFASEIEDRLTASLPADATESDAPGIGSISASLAELKQLVSGDVGSRATTQAMANLAEGIQALVRHMRSEQQMIRDWVEAQAARERKIERLLDRIAAEAAHRE